jgi:hypothetical protein
MNELDFTLYEGKSQSKTFIFTNLDNTIYNFTGSTVRMSIYFDQSSPVIIVGSITLATGRVLFNFPSASLGTPGLYEYIIEETKSDSSINLLIRGNLKLEDYVPFSQAIEAFLDTDLPADITLDENYKIQRILYWRTFLASAFYIPQASINTDSAWSMMANALISKLVAYDALMRAAKGSLLHLLSTSSSTTTSSTTGGIQEIETGPARVRFFQPSETMQQVFSSTSKEGFSVLDTLISDICGLANFLKVKVPMCKGNKVVINPQRYVNTDWLPATTLDDTVTSQG